MTEEKEDYHMNGNVGATEAATLALLTDTARAGNGRGYGYGMGGEGGGYGYSGGLYANHSSIQHGIANVAQGVEDQANCTREVLKSDITSVDKSLENLERTNSFNRICDRLTTMDNQRGQDMLQTTRELAAIRAESAKQASDALIESLKCCCETQKLIVSENSATRELINQNTIRAAVDQNNISATVGGINAAAAGNTAAIIAAIQGINHHHRG